MLTKWNHIRTSIDYAPPTNRDADGSHKKKKKKSRKSSSATNGGIDASIPSDIIIGAQFIPPHHELPIPDSNPSTSSGKGGAKKRRKADNGKYSHGGSYSDMDVDPVLCLTSPHRVVFLGKGETTSADDNALVESKSRNYITRPGPKSRFLLQRGGTATTSDKTLASSFAGIVPLGAQYDPASNLIYAIRDHGSEVAIWPAVPSSILAGPDDIDSNGEAIAAINNGKKIPTRVGKRKSDANHSAKEDLTVQHLPAPGGKKIVTLTPFCVRTSKGHGHTTVANGASGCCDDGTVWIAINFPSGSLDQKFQLVVVKGSSIEDVTSGKNRKKSSSAEKTKKSAPSRMLMDSRVIASLDNKHSNAGGGAHDDGTPNILLTIQSVLMSNDGSNDQVSFHNHQVRVRREGGGGGKQKLSVFGKRFMTQDILQSGPLGRKDLAVNLDAVNNSLSIVHKAKDAQDDAWMLTSIKLSRFDGALVKSMSSFPLPCNDKQKNATSVLSFGKVALNTVAVLMKSRDDDNSPTSVLCLKVIDFQRKAELTSACWTEGEETNAEGSIPVAAPNALNQMLCGKTCHAMITDEIGGSIALLTSSEKDRGSLDIIYSKVDGNIATQDQDTPVASRSSSLASCLRSVATSSASQSIDGGNAAAVTGGQNEKLIHVIYSNGTDDTNPHKSVVDDAIEKASQLLGGSSKQLLELHTGRGKSTPKLNTNGARSKVAKASKAEALHWNNVYQEGVKLIVEAKGGKGNRSKHLVNGIKAPDATDADVLPSLFVEMAFRETVTILLSLRKEAKQSQKEFGVVMQEVTSVLVKVLGTNLISARVDYGIKHRQGHLFLSILQACPSLPVSNRGHGLAGKLHVIDAILGHVQDIPEGALVSILRFVLRDAKIDDVVAYYSTTPGSSKRARLASQYSKLTDPEGESKKRAANKLLSEAVLDFTSKIVMYSHCNSTFLTQAMVDSINTAAEVETLLLTLSKLLKLGGASEDSDTCFHSNQVSLSQGAIHWISALTDAHMATILTMTNGGGLMIDQIQRAVRAALSQSDFANEVTEIIDVITLRGAANVVAKSNMVVQAQLKDNAIAPYTIERLTF